MSPTRIFCSLFTGIVLFAGLASPALSEISVVQVEGGLVKGIPSDTAGVQLFKGIPYAGYVGGEYRWKPAPPVEPWNGVKVADTWGDRVLQDIRGDNIPAVSENGLNLNIFTPASSANDRLPVYMLIHGGGNRDGSNTMPDLYAAELAAKGLIVVSVNYRTGPMGFLSLPEMAEESSHQSAGNYGILDLITALQWIQDNIAGFGGDPNTVTFGGQSAGGENSVALLRSPLARGLFKRAFISSSFAGFLPGKMALQEEKVLQNQQAVNEIFGRHISLEDLRKVPAEVFIAPREGKQYSIFSELHGANANHFYSIDGYAFTKTSVDLLSPGVLDGIDLMIGQAADEYTRGDPVATLTPERFASAIMAPMNYGTWGEIDEGILKYYRPETNLDAHRLYIRSRSDRLFQGVKLSAEYVDAQNTDAPVYLFYWDHAPPGRNEGFRGAYHAADIPYFNASIRDTQDGFQRYWTDPDYRMRDLASSYLANFIKTGNPNGQGLPEWGRVSENAKGQFMRFHEGRAELVTETVYPSRDAYHRAIILKANGLTEKSLRGE